MSIIKTYAYKGITIDAVQVTTYRMIDADRAAINAWLDKHDVNVTIDTEFTYGVEMSTAISVQTPDYAFYMNPGDWLAHDGDIFFHITDKVFREHYREVTGEEDTVVYATGGVLNSATGIDMYQFVPPTWRTHRPRKPRGGATMKAAYLDEVEAISSDLRARHRAKGLATSTCPYPRPKIVTGGKVHQPFIDAIRKAQDKAKADAVDQQLAGMAHHRKYAHLHMDRDGKITPARHLREELERNCHPTDTAKTTPRKRADEWRPSLEVMAMYYNQFPPTVDTEKEDADHRTPVSGTIRLHGGIAVTTKDETLVYVHAKELTRHSNGDIKITGPRFTVEYTAEAYISCNYLNAYGDVRTITSPAPGRKETEGMGEKGREAVAQSVFDAYRDNLRSCLDVIRQLTDGDSTIQSLVRQANNNLDGMHRTTPAPTTGPEATNV